MTTMTDEVLDALVKGRQYLADHEWNRDGHYFGPSEDGEPDRNRGCACALGALHAADAWVLDARRALSREVPGGHSLTGYNDHVAKSKDDILALYDRAIEARKAELA